MPGLKERTPLPSFLREGSGVSKNGVYTHPPAPSLEKEGVRLRVQVG